MKKLLKRTFQISLVILSINLLTWFLWGEQRFFEKTSLIAATAVADYDWPVVDSTFIIVPLIGPMSKEDDVYADFTYIKAFPGYKIKIIHSEAERVSYLAERYDEGWQNYGVEIRKKYSFFPFSLAKFTFIESCSITDHRFYIWCFYDWIWIH